MQQIDPMRYVLRLRREWFRDMQLGHDDYCVCGSKMIEYSRNDLAIAVELRLLMKDKPHWVQREPLGQPFRPLPKIRRYV